MTATLDEADMYCMTFTRANVSGVGTSGLVLARQAQHILAQHGISLEDAGRMMVGFIYCARLHGTVWC
jgi:hypothetical protein